MVGQSRPLDKSRKRILSAVFPVSAQISTQPTPQATPDTQFAAPGQPFGGFHDGPVSSLDELPSDPVARQIAWERAWHSATSFLRLPADLVSIHGQLEIDDLERNWLKKHPLDSPYAVKHLLRLGSGLSAPDDGPHDEPLLAWYGNEVRRHFLTLIRPRLHSVGGSHLHCAGPALIIQGTAKRGERGSAIRRHATAPRRADELLLSSFAICLPGAQGAARRG